MVFMGPYFAVGSFQPDDECVDLPALAGVDLKLVEEGVEEWDHQVDQRHHKGDQEGLCLLEWRPISVVGRVLQQQRKSVSNKDDERTYCVTISKCADSTSLDIGVY